MTYFLQWKTRYHGYNKNIKYAILATLLSQTGFGIYMVIYNFYIRELGYSHMVNGEIISLTSLGTALALVPAGLLSDQFGRKKAMIFGIALSSFLLFFRGILEARIILEVFGFLTGVFVAFLQVSAIPWLAENSQPSERVYLFSLYSAVMTAAYVVGSLLGGFLTDIFLLFTSPLLSIRYTLIIGSAIYFTSFFFVIRLKEKKRERKERNRSFTLRDFFRGNRNGLKIIGLFAISQVLIGFGSGLVIPYLNLYFADRFGASNSVIGLIISLGQAVTAFAMIIGPAVVQRVGEVRAVVYLQLLSLPFLFLTAFTQNLFLAAFGFLFRQALMNAGNPIQSSLIMGNVQDSMKGLANSINQMVFNLGWALMGPVSTSIVMDSGPYWGYAKVFSITATLYFIASLYFYFVFRKTKTDQETVLDER
ncbi:MFS transporter [Fervidibacillus halotolerans]|uniref:MFS transporter n=1 Tax=Fervidibacillus halotolerans TaxID=2980027 RepID=A0A9E8RZR7_9BACI|nr:MFS transporter [Fervidibacillus halotolerans]WAA11912.1 MFS transporter [Fervidibacillus halotolerans]